MITCEQNDFSISYVFKLVRSVVQLFASAFQSGSEEGNIDVPVFNDAVM